MRQRPAVPCWSSLPGIWQSLWVASQRQGGSSLVPALQQTHRLHGILLWPKRPLQYPLHLLFFYCNTCAVSGILPSQLEILLRGHTHFNQACACLEVSPNQVSSWLGKMPDMHACQAEQWAKNNGQHCCRATTQSLKLGRHLTPPGELR